jgi:hypothetical protein
VNEYNLKRQFLDKPPTRYCAFRRYRTHKQIINRKKRMTYLQITLNVAPKNRSAAAEVYKKYKAPFLSDIPGAESKKLAGWAALRMSGP